MVALIIIMAHTLNLYNDNYYELDEYIIKINSPLYRDKLNTHFTTQNMIRLYI